MTIWRMRYNGIDGQPGFVNHWVGNKKVGEGEQEITAIEEKTIYTDLRFIKPFKSFAKVKMTAEAIGKAVQKSAGDFKVNELSLEYYEAVYEYERNDRKKDFSTGLTNLKNLLEKLRDQTV